MDSPTFTDRRAIPNARPTANMTRTSMDTLSDTHPTILGMNLSPIIRLTHMNIRMLTIITISESTFMDEPARMGVIIDNMTT